MGGALDAATILDLDPGHTDSYCVFGSHTFTSATWTNKTHFQCTTPAFNPQNATFALTNGNNEVRSMMGMLYEFVDMGNISHSHPSVTSSIGKSPNFAAKMFESYLAI